MHDMTVSQAAGRGLRPAVWKVERLAAELRTAGRPLQVWQSFGTVRGRGEMFAKTNFRIRPDGSAVESVRSNGNTLCAYPLGNGRTVRLLVH